jgi:hypothetical protein
VQPPDNPTQPLRQARVTKPLSFPPSTPAPHPNLIADLPTQPSVLPSWPANQQWNQQQVSMHTILGPDAMEINRLAHETGRPPAEVANSLLAWGIAVFPVDPLLEYHIQDYAKAHGVSSQDVIRQIIAHVHHASQTPPAPRPLMVDQFPRRRRHLSPGCILAMAPFAGMLLIALAMVVVWVLFVALSLAASLPR